MNAKKAATLVAGVLLAVGAAAPAVADAGAQGAAVNSPGFLSGNVAQFPVHVPFNLCGNSLNVAALLNPAFGNACVNA